MSEQLTDAQRDLLSTVVHDLKNPISAVKSYADLIKQSGPLNEQQQRFLLRIYTTLENMHNLVNDLLDMAWIDEGMILHKAPCNLLDVVRRQINALEGSAQEKGLTLHLSTDDNLAVIQADEKRLNQVVGNLVSNSIKYSKPNGQVWIHVSRHNTGLQVSIRDEGIGIAPEDLPHVFERFFRGRQKAASYIEGSGLGLFIAKAIIEGHGGTIHVESTEGKGSTFEFTLPF